jgi:hypothetical protein
MKLSLIYHTIKHLKPIQIKYQVYYRSRKKWHQLSGFKYPLSIEKEGTPLKLTPSIPRHTTFNDYTFTFLNQSKTFPKNNLDWNYPEYGKLWTYNLNYFDLLLQENMDRETGLELINDFIKNLNQNSVGLEPYPISLRGINWIKFISNIEEFTQRTPREDAAPAARNEQKDSLRSLRDTAAPAARNEQKGSLRSPRESFAPAARNKIDASLYAQYQILLNNLEYHLLANHLLENGFSLLFGAFYFKDETLYSKAKEIITEQLEEQILDDGAHFELSPMYHQIILDRLLDSINLVQNNERFESQNQLLELMQVKAHKMLPWLNQITFSNGQIPLLNDAAPGIAPTTKQINDYAKRLNLIRENSCNPWTLSESGYRRYNGKKYECIFDIGPIGPTNQPGHAHADTFNFVLNVNDEPLIVDNGISTYNPGETRLKERGTPAHNTVTINNNNSSEVWSSFRVARRATVNILKEDEKTVTVQHDGYKRIGTTHRREWNFSENQIQITDTLTGKITEGKAHLWLAPHLNLKQKGQTIETESATLNFENAESVNIMPAQIPYGYNQFSDTYKIEISFKEYLKTIIQTS